AAAGSRAIAQNTLADGTLVTNALTTPAGPKGFVTLWGTGLGNATTQDVAVTVGGRPATVTYAGHSATPGLDQINIQIPDDPQVPEGCYVAVQASVPLEYGGASITEASNRVSISLASAGATACTHPLNLTLPEMQTLDQGGTIPVLNMGMQSLVGAAASNGLVRMGATNHRIVASRVTLRRGESSGAEPHTKGVGRSCPKYALLVSMSTPRQSR
ncbi:MAG TPA: hypothetical protein VGT04_11050, partial [Acidobacteriaceae bacterium]|nr:hypothetical protein [Acidobacteriaceae bacterium]